MKTVHLNDTPYGEPSLGISILVTNYGTGDYCGSGFAYALRDDNVVEEYNLGHCSCYGPFEDSPDNSWPYPDFEQLVTGDEVTVGTVADLTAAKRLVEEVRRG